MVTRLPDVFLSYSREDQATVRRYAEALEREGFKVWWDDALNPGETFDQVTEQALKEAKAVVVLWSKHSVISRWVRSEATQADRFGTLVPVMIEACDRPILFELSHTSDLSRWKGDQRSEEWRSFVASLRRLVDKSGASAPAAPNTQGSTTSAAGSVGASQRSRRGPVAWVTIAAAIAVSAGLLWQFGLRESKESAGAPVGSGASVSVPHASIAVLPFRDMSASQDQEYFADGVTEEILNTLAGLKDLKVTARTSAFAFKGKDIDLRQVGETLGVQHILEGSIRKDGENLRITAQLIDTKSDAHVWSKTYNQSLKDIFQVQEDIARSVAEALQVTLGVGFGNQPGMTRDVEAYDAYLQALPLWPRFTTDTRRRGVELLERAVARDPAFALAWGQLSSLAESMPSLIGANASGEEVQAWRRKAETAFLRFEALMQGTPELHMGMAFRDLNAGRLVAAAEHFEAATARTPPRVGGLPETGPAILSLMVGRSRQAVAQLEEEKARDPLAPAVATILVHAYGNVGDFEAAIAEAERAYGMGNGTETIAAAAAITHSLGERNKVQILRWLDAEGASGAPHPVTPDFNVRMKQLLDNPVEALAYLQTLAQDPAGSSVTMTAIGVYQAYFGDPEAAIQSVRLAHERGLPIVANLMLWHSVMRDARKLPEFKTVARDFGLVDYWKRFGWADLCKPIPGGDDFECT